MDKKDWQKKGAGHRQRLRDKFLKQGISSFTESDIIELVVSMGTPRQDCKDRARAALKCFGSLPGVLEASMEDLRKVPGFGEKNVFAIKFIHEVARVFLKKKAEEKKYVHAASDVMEFLWHSFSHKKKEVFVLLCLDAQNGIIDIEEIFHGSLTASAVYPREVIKKALDKHAASMVIAHNHPSGSTNPSSKDKEITKRLLISAALFDMDILDHIIIGGTGRYFSFAEEGIMESLRREAKEVLYFKR